MAINNINTNGISVTLTALPVVIPDWAENIDFPLYSAIVSPASEFASIMALCPEKLEEKDASNVPSTRKNSPQRKKPHSHKNHLKDKSKHGSHGRVSNNSYDFWNKHNIVIPKESKRINQEANNELTSMSSPIENFISMDEYILSLEGEFEEYARSNLGGFTHPACQMELDIACKRLERAVGFYNMHLLPLYHNFFNSHPLAQDTRELHTYFNEEFSNRICDKLCALLNEVADNYRHQQENYKELITSKLWWENEM